MNLATHGTRKYEFLHSLRGYDYFDLSKHIIDTDPMYMCGGYSALLQTL